MLPVPEPPSSVWKAGFQLFPGHQCRIQCISGVRSEELLNSQIVKICALHFPACIRKSCDKPREIGFNIDQLWICWSGWHKGSTSRVSLCAPKVHGYTIWKPTQLLEASGRRRMRANCVEKTQLCTDYPHPDGSISTYWTMYICAAGSLLPLGTTWICFNLPGILERAIWLFFYNKQPARHTLLHLSWGGGNIILRRKSQNNVEKIGKPWFPPRIGSNKWWPEPRL